MRPSANARGEEPPLDSRLRHLLDFSQWKPFEHLNNFLVRNLTKVCTDHVAPAQREAMASSGGAAIISTRISFSNPNRVTFCQTFAGEVLERARNKLGH